MTWLATYGLEYVVAIIGICWLLLQLPDPAPYPRRVFIIVIGVVLILCVVLVPLLGHH